MKIKIFSLLFGFFLILNLACKNQETISNLDLNGSWKVVDYKTPGISVGDSAAKPSIGNIAVIKNNVITVNLLNRTFKCKVDESPKMVKKEKSPLFDQADKGTLDLQDFGFEDNVFCFDADGVDDTYNFYGATVNGDGNEMILSRDGVYYLLVRQKDN